MASGQETVESATADETPRALIRSGSGLPPPGAAPPCLVHALAIAEFDILKGNTLSLVVPESWNPPIDRELMACLCLPDGGHLHEHDQTVMVLNDPTAPDGYVYALAVFRSKANPLVARGAVQKALCVVLAKPIFATVAALVRACLDALLDGAAEPSALCDVLTALNAALGRALSVTLFGREHALAMPALGPDELSGASLVDLVVRFGDDTMVIWAALLTGKRIMFTGQPAAAVCNCVLAAPLLVRPVGGFLPLLTPYVCLQDTSPVERAAHISGSTNLLFEVKTNWSDVVASFASRRVLCAAEPMRPSSDDKRFIRQVLAGIHDASRGEQWVRRQFEAHTRETLHALEGDRLKGAQRKALAGARDNVRVARALAALSAAPSAGASELAPARSPLAALATLAHSHAPNGLALTSLESQKALFELDRSLVDLCDLALVCEPEHVELVAGFLASPSAQCRKYALSIIAQLAGHPRGQLCILCSDVVVRVVALLADPMENVLAAASGCVLRLAGLFAGATLLVESGTIAQLFRLVATPEVGLIVKTQAADALRKLYAFVPGTAPLDPQPLFLALFTENAVLRRALHLLLDSWGCALPGIGSDAGVIRHLDGLCSQDSTTRVAATAYALAQIGADEYVALQLVEAGAMEIVIDNERSVSSDDPLAALSLALLGGLVQSSTGRRRALRLRVGERAIAALAMRSAEYLFRALSLLESLAQSTLGADALVAKGACTELVGIVADAWATARAPLCLPALGALSHLARFARPAHTRAIAKALGPVRALAPHSSDEALEAARVTTLSVVDAMSLRDPSERAEACIEMLLAGIRAAGCARAAGTSGASDPSPGGTSGASTDVPRITIE